MSGGSKQQTEGTFREHNMEVDICNNNFKRRLKSANILLRKFCFNQLYCVACVYFIVSFPTAGARFNDPGEGT